MPSYSLTARLALLASVLYPVVVFFMFPNWVIDDAFITFRYADNLAHYGALTWNVGEPPIEGYTGVFLPVVLSGALTLGIDPIAATLTLGIAAFFLGWLFLFLLLRRMSLRPLASAFALFLYGTTPILFTHATSGLETVIFLASLLLSFYFFLGLLAREGRGIAFSATLLLTSLVRPEGVAFSGILFLFAALFLFRHRRAALPKFLLAFLSLYLLPALAYFLWRFSYYGALLPNTFYAKRGSWSLNVFLDIARFLKRELAAPLAAAALVILPELDFFRAKLRQDERTAMRTRLLYFFGAQAVFAAVLIAFLSHSHLMTNFSTRFYTPLLPSIFLALACLFSASFDALERLKPERPLARRFLIAAFALLFLYQAVLHLAGLPAEMKFAREEKTAKESQHYLAGKYLAAVMPPSEWLVVYLDAGAVSYFSKMKVVDFGALNDPYLARHALSLPERIDYFYSKHPAALFFTSTSLERVAYTAESDAITADPRFKNYILAKRYPFPFDWPEKYHELLFVRSDLYAKQQK